MTPGQSVNLSKPVRVTKKSLDERSEESADSDPDTKELDDYLARRLEIIEQNKKSKADIKVISVSKSSKQKVIVDEDSEYEYILESEEEEEEEWVSVSEEAEAPIDQIFTSSFLIENNAAPTQNNAIAKKSSNPLQVASKFKHSKEGNISQLKVRRSTLTDNGKAVKIEERKEDSYIHPALENSTSFSNISVIMGQHNFDRTRMLSFQENSFEDEELEFEREFSEIYNSDSKINHNKLSKQSMIDSVSDGEYREHQMDNNVKYLKNDMDRITKDLEMIRDLVMTTPEARNLLENINDKRAAIAQNKQETDEEIDDITEDAIEEQYIDESEYELPEYDSCDISDIINNKMTLHHRFQNTKNDDDSDSI
jgi:hypothetical protein